MSVIPMAMGGSSWNRMEAEVGLKAYHMRLNVTVFIEGEEGKGQRAPFMASSGWEPRKSQVAELVWRIMEDQRIMKGM